MSVLYGLLFLIMVMILVMYSPYFTRVIKETIPLEKKEGFKSSQNILRTVGKEAITPYTLYLNDYDSGNAKRHMSRMPSVVNGGFGIPDAYTFHPVPKYTDGYELAIKDEPRAAEFNRGSHNDPVHLYFQNLYGTLENEL
jgi:hypothetical protein